MFLPMHDLEPAPNCLDKSQRSFYFTSSGGNRARTASRLCSIELSCAGSTPSQRSGRNSCTSGPQMVESEWITQALTPTTVWKSRGGVSFLWVVGFGGCMIDLRPAGRIYPLAQFRLQGPL